MKIEKKSATRGINVVLLMCPLLFFFASADPCPPGIKTAGPPPDGDITVSPDYEDATTGANLVAASKTLALKATNLTDKDCCCGSLVDDYIDPDNDTWWKCDSNSVAPTSGQSTTYTAGTSANYSPDEVDLQVIDEAQKPCTTADFSAQTTVDSIFVITVVPNTDPFTWDDPGCVGGTYGDWHRIFDKVDNTEYSGADYSNYVLSETKSAFNIHDGCGIWTEGIGSGGGAAEGKINYESSTAPPDYNYDCFYPNITIPVDCVSTSQTQWSYTEADGTTTSTFFTRQYQSVEVGPAPANLNNLSNSETIVSYP